ncbi:CLUMA_CG008892, isoform A [Clunio marinus]|uniref:CLUMA_CG008892, isoform A n=1 Tax=Clunio marinus TaxID=568069 RepID=A0A1J1I6Z9_9DIPT|nr:CLUMA_CG008892, isoform A [Clunio marinus]
MLYAEINDSAFPRLAAQVATLIKKQKKHDKMNKEAKSFQFEKLVEQQRHKENLCLFNTSTNA